MIDHAHLRTLLDYDSISGIFTRKVAVSRRSKIGDIAGGLSRGYVELSVNGKVYRAHTLAWFYYNKKWPIKNLDHIDLNKSNNAINNLREASYSENIANSLIRKTNSCGFKGVTRHKEKFKAAIMVNRKRIHLGIFTLQKEAAEAYDSAAIHYFGAFALTNKQQGLLL